MKRILIVEDDVTFAVMMKTWLARKGFQVEQATSVGEAEKQIPELLPDLILSDLRLPDKEGIELLVWMRQQDVEIPLIVMTGYADIETAVQSIKLGAQDYVSKPINPDLLYQKIERALALPDERKEKPVRTQEKKEVVGAAFLEGESEVSKKLYNYVRLVAPTDMSVLITGDSGTGKEYVAHRIHALSRRASAPFVAIDCGTIPRELAASEFFGHKKGSFTGALSDKTGAFVEANGGTIFLDEIGNLSYEVQVQLLRVLQERKVKPIGSNTEVAIDVRLVAATNEDLPSAIARGDFRGDLYHRINEFSIAMPRLCERQGDVRLFADFFLDRANRELGKQVVGFDEEALHQIARYDWPGNLREMKNTIRKAVLLTVGDYISARELDLKISDKPVTAMPLHDEADERARIADALRRTGNNKSKAAELLRIDRKTLYNKLKYYHME